MMRNYLFEGSFMSLVRGRASQGMLCDEYTLTKIKFFNVIESQHGSERKFKGRLNLRLILLLPFPNGTGKIKQAERTGMYHTCRPTLSLFIRTLEDLLAGLLFTDGSIIVSVQAEKRISATPSVEFILTEIE
jgi:Holliday junction resolvase RusA-like endonuclease